MTTTIPFGRALYYPHINFKNEEWLKFAALYYDGIDRIVPSLDLVEETNFIKKLNDNAENEETVFVRNIHPDYYVDEIASEFIKYVKTDLSNPTKRKEIFSRISSLVPENTTYSVHAMKMGSRLKNELPLLGIPIKQFSFEFENWYELDAITGSIYMSRLANHIATKKSLPLVSDDATFLSIVRAAQKEQNLTDISETLASMVIQTVVPRNMAAISTDTIVKFRKNYRDERHAFYLEVNNLVKDLYKIEDEGSLKDALHFRKNQIESASKNIRDVFTSLKIDSAIGLIGLSIPSFMSGLGWAVAGVGLVAVAAGKLTMKGIEYRKTRRNSPFSYLLTLKQEIEKEELAKSLLKGKIVF